MTTSTEEKIIALQEKVLFQEDAIQNLDGVIRKQYDLIDALTRRLKTLEEKLDMLEDELENQPATLVDEKPPHY